jgi:hypothetical protein
VGQDRKDRQSGDARMIALLAVKSLLAGLVLLGALAVSPV